MQNKPLASSEPEANSLGSILLKSTLQHRFSCSCKYNNITYSEELVKKKWHQQTHKSYVNKQPSITGMSSNFFLLTSVIIHYALTNRR